MDANQRQILGGLICWCCAALPAVAVAADASPPPVMLAEVYDANQQIDIADYWISEKLDGVRAYWDGTQLLTRAGNVIHAPPWFTAHWPRTALDGELWAGRGRFEQASGTVRHRIPDEQAWRQMRFMVFDLPTHSGEFTQRLAALATLRATSPWLQVVEQFQLADSAALMKKLDEVLAHGGEGLMLHRSTASYRAGRTDDLLKYKQTEDAEARVIGYEPGNGKYQGMLGALLVERADGIRFHIGGGFTDEQRRNPPPFGSVITYAYNGLTATGVPRFARFVRVREMP